MEEGLFQLLFILLIFVAAIFDSIARGRKKRQRMEELEREEGGELEADGPGAATGTAESRPSPGWETSDWEPTEWEPQGEPKGGAKGEPGHAELPPAEPEPTAEDRATADQMVPEDFWAILTGQQPPPRQEAPPPEEESSPATREERAPARREPSPTPRSRSRESRREPASDLGRRSDPDPPERPHIPEPVPGDRYRKRDEADLTESAGITSGIGDPWVAVPDISQGEIGVERPGRRRPPRSKRRFPGPDATRGRSASRYARLLEAGDREALREAVVLREILDVPLARRGSFGGWEEEGR